MMPRRFSKHRIIEGYEKMVISITEENRKLFEGLAPLDMLIQHEGQYCLGYISEDDEVQYAAGILTFDIQQEETGIVAAVMKWLYVSVEFRELGAARELLGQMARMLMQAQVDTIRCDIPFPDEYDGLCNYLEGMCFEFTIENRYELLVTLSELTRSDMEKKTSGQKQTEVRPLGNVQDTVFHRELLEILQEKENRKSGSMWEFLQRESGIRKEAYEQTISCSVCHGNETKGYFLVRRYPSGMLEPVLLAGTGSCTGRDMLAMLQYALQKACELYTSDTEVRIICRSEETAGLIEYLFPGAEPELIRRGYCETQDLSDIITE